VNTPSASADGFLDKLCGNPLAWRPKAGSQPEACPYQHDLCRRHIAVSDTTAVDTAVYSFGEGLTSDRAALWACLACTARVNQLQRATGAFCLVADALDQLFPRGVVHRLGEHPCRQSFDVQILHCDVGETAHDRCGQLVREVPPPIGRLGAMSGKPDLGLPAALATPFASGQGTLQTALLLGCKSGVLRCGHGLAVGQGNKGREAEIDADRRERPLWERCVGELDLETDVPLAARTADDSRADLGAWWQGAVPTDFDFARYADDAKALALADCQTIADAKVCTVKARLGAEPREAGLGAALHPAEECAVSLVETPQNLLLGTEAEASETFVGFPDSLQLGCLVAIAQPDAASLVRLDALLQASIVEIAERAEHSGQGDTLRCVRAKPVFVGPAHLSALLRGDVSTDCRFRHCANRADEVGPRPQRRKPRAQRREFFTQHPRRDRLKPRRDFGRSPAGIGLDERVNVVRHNFEGVHRHFPVVSNLTDQFLEPDIDWADQNRATVFRTEHEVILEAENSPGVSCKSRFLTAHA